jgi:hypothetical protein
MLETKFIANWVSS